MHGWTPRWKQYGVLAAVCVLVITTYACTARPSYMVSTGLNAADAGYNLLVQGFRAGQLSLKKEVPPGFMQLADPYDPSANVSYRLGTYRMLDLSYYKGRLYLYFGVTPALVLFWPFFTLTGHYLFHMEAAVFFCMLGFLVSLNAVKVFWLEVFVSAS